MPIAHSDVVALVLAEFPELRLDLEDETTRGLLHVEMGEFARYAQEAKGRGDWDTYTRALKLANRFLMEGDGAVDNAVCVSFLEHIDFQGPRGQQAWTLLSPQQQRTWRQINDGWGRPVPRWMK